MPDYRQFFIDKTPHPFSDTLLLHGFARLLEALGVNASGIEIVDRGTYFSIDLHDLLTSEAVEAHAAHTQIIPFVRTLKNASAIAETSSIRVVDYEAEKAQSSAFFKARNSGGEAPPPSPEWAIYRAINPGALQGYNNLVLDWYIACTPETLYLLLDLFSTTPNDVDSAVEAWKQLDKLRGWRIAACATALQLFNPDSGKGHNKVKGDRLSIGNLDRFWLLEYLKAAGFYAGAITRTLRESKDRKTLVITPRALTFSENLTVMGKFAESMQISLYPTQFDILAVIRYTQALIEHAIARRGRYALKGTPIKRRIVGGFQSAFYKDMGNSAAAMNISFLGLPGWVMVTSQADVDLFTHPETGLLTEFEKFVRQFNEKESDVPELLRPLRDFVSGDDLAAFFQFTRGFPEYAVGRKERGKYVQLLTTYFIERIIMSQDDKRYQAILETPGFQNIAYAIRQSTVTAQYRKKQGDRKYDVRYGLGQELARKSRYPGEFIIALTDFLHKYNAENAQVMETRPKPYRRSIVTTDIDDIVQLIDVYGSEPVANLLIAYGYARLPQQETSDEDEPAPEEFTELDNGE